ncbi:MAG TPA: hypothetical protein VJ044_01995, partial [Candidatus Hodarchaeales archaeon]|nr:hypothetical protein [Candidatus Hodarchaeales archaeon]
MNGRAKINLPKTRIATLHGTKKVGYTLHSPTSVVSQNQRINSFLVVVRPEFGQKRICATVESIKGLFRKFGLPNVCLFLILQHPTISHFSVLQKLALARKSFYELNAEFPTVLLFPKFIDILMDPWPVVLKDLYWLNQFNGSVELQNDQFLRLLDISESSNDFSPLIALNVVPSNKVKILNSAENEITTERHINIPVRTLCFGCRQFVREGWNICSECGAILCKTCVAILN